MRHVFAFPLVLGFLWMAAHPASGGNPAVSKRHNSSKKKTSLIFKPDVPEEEPTKEEQITKSIIGRFWKDMTRNKARASRDVLLRKRDREQPHRVQIKAKNEDDRKDAVIKALDIFGRDLDKEGEKVDVDELEHQEKQAVKKLGIKTQRREKNRQHEKETWKQFTKDLKEIPKVLAPKLKETRMNGIVEQAKFYKNLLDERRASVKNLRKEGVYLRYHDENNSPTKEQQEFEKTLKEMGWSEEDNEETESSSKNKSS